MIRGLTVFDLDGTLLRGETVCEILARPLGRIEEMKRFERLSTEASISNARQQMAGWYEEHEVETLYGYLEGSAWAPGAREAVRELQDAGVLVAIASITWKFAVRWFAQQLNVKHFLGTDISSEGEIVHVWGRDKARWFREIRDYYGVAEHRTAAIGDSRGDMEMLQIAGLGFLVGSDAISELSSVVHLPEADLRSVTARIIDAWAE
jgi:HAD superfamily phosphoserine phosphatase-like hydrolase